MRQLTTSELEDIHGGFKLHFNLIPTFFAVVGVSLLNPVAGGIMIAGVIATQGTGQLVDMYIDEFGQVQSR